MESPTGDKPTGENPSPPYFAAANDDFFWPELSSSGELSNLNTFSVTMVSLPTTPESTPTTTTKTTVPTTATIVTTRNDDEKEESEKVEDSTKDLNLKMEVYDEINNGGEKKVNGRAMECLIKVLKELYCGNYDDDDNNKEVDLLETVKNRGITFPKNRGFGNS